jgi:hypothetical protein
MEWQVWPTLICVWLGENTAGVMVVQLESECFLIIDFYFRKKINGAKGESNNASF